MHCEDGKLYLVTRWPDYDWGNNLVACWRGPGVEAVPRALTVWTVWTGTVMELTIP
jgi:hypothetical protein